MEIEFECAGCENRVVDSFSLHRGTLLCGYCLEDWLNYTNNPCEIKFHQWLLGQRIKMDLDRNKNNDIDEEQCVNHAKGDES